MALDPSRVHRSMLKHMVTLPRSFFSTMQSLLGPGIKFSLDVCDDDAKTAFVDNNGQDYKIVLGMGMARLGPFIEDVMNGASATSLLGRARFMLGRTFGVSPLRRGSWDALQLQVFGLALDFVVAHEIGHVVGGHFRLRRSRSAERLHFSETFHLAPASPSVATSDCGLTPLDSQALELHADLIAAYLVRGSAEVGGLFMGGVQESDQRAEMSRFAAMCLAFFFAKEAVPSNSTLRDWSNSRHPHPLNRMMTLRNDEISESAECIRTRAFNRVILSKPWIEWRKDVFVQSSPRKDPVPPQADENERAYNALMDRLISLEDELGDYRKRIVAISRGELLSSAL